MSDEAGSLFSGIDVFGYALRQCGIPVRWQSEINRPALSILKREYPDAEQLGDVKRVNKENAAPVSIIVGGSPCQNFSIAGNREGLAGKESQLFGEYIRVVSELRPALAVWENVPGAFTSNAGRDFYAVLRAFWDIGARDIAWRTLDSQYAGVPQRRRRIFLVADFRGRRAGEILFEPSSAYGHRPPRGKAGSEVAFTLTGGNQRNDANNQVAFDARNMGVSDSVTGTLQDGSTLNAMPLISGTLAGSGAGSARPAGQGNELDFLIPDAYRIRRLTPRECERLQGLPDDFTRYGHDGKELSDSARYKLIGNSITLPVAIWLMSRLVDTRRRIPDDWSPL